MKYTIVLALVLMISSCVSVDGELKETPKKQVEEVSVNVENSGEGSATGEEEITSELKLKSANIDLKDIEVVKVTLDSENTQIESDAIQISGQQITIKKSGNYEFTGTLSDGQIVVETQDEKDVQIILNNVEITNSQSSAIFVANAEQTVINLADGSKNIVTDASSYNNTGEIEANAAIFSHDDLVFTGVGELVVNANYRDGITSKDKLFIESGTISVVAVDDGIRGKDYLQIDGGKVIVEAQGDALRSNHDEKGTIIINNGEVTVSAGDDAINATQFLVINDGTVTVEKSYEALESRDITLNGGTISLTSSDDGINVSSGSSEDEQSGGFFGNNKGGHNEPEDIFLRINGGKITLNSQGDGLDSNGDIIMTGGEVVVYGPTEDNNGALDYNGDYQISGGTLIAIGSSGMASAPGENSSQNSVLIGLESAYSAGDSIVITNNSQAEIFNITSPKSFQAIAISSPELTIGENYSVSINGSQVQEFSPTGVVTTFGETGRGGRGGGRR